MTPRVLRPPTTPIASCADGTLATDLSGVVAFLGVVAVWWGASHLRQKASTASALVFVLGLAVLLVAGTFYANRCAAT
jgi:hypothetical protein